MTEPGREFGALKREYERKLSLTQAELATFARAFRLAVPSPALREEYLRRAEAELAREAAGE